MGLQRELNSSSAASSEMFSRLYISASLMLLDVEESSLKAPSGYLSLRSTR